MSVRKTFETLRANHQVAFIPYITVGDPTLSTSRAIIRTLVEEGAQIIELGVPFSDPVADGVIIQRSSERALKHGTSLKDVLSLSRTLRQEGISTPFVLFSYFNPILKMGLKSFAEQARLSGINAVLVVDLPPEEAIEHYTFLSAAGIECVFLASPTTREDRLNLINTYSTGFVYYISRTGVTGMQDALSTSLESEITRIKNSIQSPIAIGFGISTPEQASKVANLGDGVVVGSAIVNIIEKQTNCGSSLEKCCEDIRTYVRQIIQKLALNSARI